MRVSCFPAILSAVVICVTAAAQNEDVTFEVIGVPEGDTLSVRSDAGANFDSVAELVNGDGGIRILGMPVMNGRDDWVHISFAGGDGWVRPKYLRREQAPSQSMSPTALKGTDDATKDQRSTVIPTERTLEVWRNYSQIREETRTYDKPDPEPELAALGKLDYTGADSIVTQQIQDNIATFRALAAANAKARPVIASQQAKRELFEAFRPQARVLGERFMPDIGTSEEMRREGGKALGELMLLYVFSAPTDKKEIADFYILRRMLDRLVIQESLINARLGLEDSKALKEWLGGVRDRACAARLLQGRWESREVNGRTTALKFGTDPNSFLQASGHLAMVRDSGRRSKTPWLGDQDDFIWKFERGVFRMTEITWAQIGGLPQVWRSFRAVFTSPGVFEISDEKGVPIGTWRRLD